MTRMRLGGALVMTCMLEACGDGNKYLENVPAKYTEVAEIHHAQCGGCHVRVEPGERTRAQFEKALDRHHKRVKLEAAQWPVLIDYLSQTP